MRPATLPLVLLLALCCCGTAAAQLSSVPAGPMCGPRPDTTILHLDLAGQPGRFPRDAELDSVWIKLDRELDGCPILNHPDRWLVRMPWCTISGLPGCHRVGDAIALAEKHQLSDTTHVSVRFYYYTVRARTAAEAALQAKKQQPRSAPRAVLKALQKEKPAES